MSTVKRHSEIHIVALLAAVATVTLLLVSPDSYLHDLCNRVDSAWFYICGKAWMNGLTPYVDFTDSKGPLLWLVYGLAYLISPRDYTGVYWLSCLALTVTLWLNYRSALLVFRRRRWAVAVALLMPLAYFYPYIHEEVKTEFFTLPLVALCLYGTLLLHHGEGLLPRTPRRVLAVTGAAMGCALMVKYTFVPMLAIFALFSLLSSRRHGIGLVASLLWLTGGFAAAVLPWVLWMLAIGNLHAFVQQYFVNTLGTVGQLHAPGWLGYLIKEQLLLRHVPWSTLFPLLCGGGALLWTFTIARHTPASHASQQHATPAQLSLAIVTTAWFFICTVPNAWWIYYYEICTWTLFFGIAAVLWLIARHHRPPTTAMLAAMAVAVVATSGAATIALHPANFCASDHPARDTYYRYAWLMQQVDHPTVVYWDIYSCGFETPAGGLPGTLYWASQNGATPAMRAAQAEAVRRGEADFVLVADTLHDAQLRQWGYHRWDFSNRDNNGECDDLLYTLYTRHTLQAPPANIRPPRPFDVITKRWPDSFDGTLQTSTSAIHKEGPKKK